MVNRSLFFLIGLVGFVLDLLSRVLRLQGYCVEFRDLLFVFSLPLLVIFHVLLV